MINSTDTNAANKSGGAFSLGRGCTSNLLPDYANASVQGPSGLSGGLSDTSGYNGYLQAARPSIPEDSARRLFDTLYDALVYATPEDRRKAVLMPVAAYDLLV